ncbi:protocatechuate 3,4-dioxygenase subunit beta [Brevundimonas sp. S30B]|uniref:protocatechuate 3,4-dioxygenase subunit beta n=2 Tax=unclassified Brevundimonas TaxID=2622653 RepID=UPI001072E30A|nr:protocatechuate 3,4-dioxygenase subunit beta [Brevundimonas sp. S30B]QBX38844.1 protocatechuate 3,4-dioxygenase subunit beta [Brevundimonas sp. MF30-B]TFW04660.1 protocatechuate 3,4-dioxygenase subunit beta [Brevundimonas sp. S30B]
MVEREPYSPEDAGHPPSLHRPYGSTLKRSPGQPLVRIPQTLTETTGPSNWAALAGPSMTDLTRRGSAEAIGQRIIVSGRVLDDRGRPVAGTAVELWQANAAGRYMHHKDRWDAPLDPNFTGSGLAVTDDQGRYRFVTIRPGAYPWGNHSNAWRPEHIHFSVFGPAFAARLVTQMYFPGDPLIALDPIANASPPEALERLISRFDLETTEEAHALGYVFDIVLRGRQATPMETD